MESILIKNTFIFFSIFSFFILAEEKDEGFVREIYRDLRIFDALENDSRELIGNPREAENPFSHLINLPIQYNSYRNVGHNDDIKNVINIKPQIPFILSDDWYALTKTDLTLTTKGAKNSKGDRDYGFGDTLVTTWFSPINDSNWAWGLGPAINFPTGSSSYLSSKKWSLGPSGAIGYIDDTWFVAASVTNIWSVAGRGDQEVNAMNILPLVSYNINKAFYVISAPTITSNWRAEGETWTVPLGGGFGHLIKFDHHIVNLQFQSFYNVIHTDYDGEWSARFQIQYFFPKKRKAFFEQK